MSQTGSIMNQVDTKLEVGHHPRVRRRAIQAVLRTLGLEVRRRTAAAPGTAEGGLVVSDIEAAHNELIGRGVDASEVWHGAPFPPRHGSGAPTPSA